MLLYSYGRGGFMKGFRFRYLFLIAAIGIFVYLAYFSYGNMQNYVLTWHFQESLLRCIKALFPIL